jgi:hypothetical protein
MKCPPVKEEYQWRIDSSIAAVGQSAEMDSFLNSAGRRNNYGWRMIFPLAMKRTVPCLIKMRKCRLISGGWRDFSGFHSIAAMR